jgi:hypothetical protein
MQDVGHRVQGTGSRMQDAGCRMQQDGKAILGGRVDPESCIRVEGWAGEPCIRAALVI